jgi:hypothetical protein
MREKAAVTAALALFCVALCLLASQLSGAAGRLPLLVALLTLVPVALQFRRDLQRAPAAPNANASRERSATFLLLALLVVLYLAGFLVALPAFAAFHWRSRPGAAVAAAAIVFGFLYFGFGLLHVDLYEGAAWNWWASR